MNSRFAGPTPRTGHVALDAPLVVVGAEAGGRHHHLRPFDPDPEVAGEGEIGSPSVHAAVQAADGRQGTPFEPVRDRLEVDLAAGRGPGAGVLVVEVADVVARAEHPPASRQDHHAERGVALDGVEVAVDRLEVRGLDAVQLVGAVEPEVGARALDGEDGGWSCPGSSSGFRRGRFAGRDHTLPAPPSIVPIVPAGSGPFARRTGAVVPRRGKRRHDPRGPGDPARYADAGRNRYVPDPTPHGRHRCVTRADSFRSARQPGPRRQRACPTPMRVRPIATATNSPPTSPSKETTSAPMAATVRNRTTETCDRQDQAAGSLAGEIQRLTRPEEAIERRRDREVADSDVIGAGIRRKQIEPQTGHPGRARLRSARSA